MGMPLRAGLAAALAVAGSAVTAGAQAPSLRDVVGHDFGERITVHAEMQRYLERLAEASPRVAVRQIGASWEGRALMVAIVTAPENHARLEAIREASLRLHDPRRDPAGSPAADQPAIVWFGGSIHGFELSGSEGALKLLERLATRDDAATLEVLRHVVVLIDPMLNPDGRDAFAQLNHARIGRVPSANRDDWSNDFDGWEGLQFRTGHYFFDNNRDWFAQTQRATRARSAFLQRWQPQVAIDMHEMGPDVEFYFDPPGDPTNPHFPAFASRWFQTFGNAYAAAFDSAGYEYMTRERYNYFYPGYTSSRAYAGGAVAMLFEQASTRGLALTRGDESVRTLADALEQQYLAAWTATRVAAANRERLLTEYVASQREVIADGGRGVRRYLIDPTAADRHMLEAIVRLLRNNGIEAGALTGPATLEGVRDRTGGTVGRRAFPAGTIVIEAAQPTGRLIRTLFEPDTPIPPAFLREARARVERDENPRFYDITAWSLPLLFNLAGFSTTDGRVIEIREAAAPAAGWPGQAAYAYVLDGRNTGTAAALFHLRSRGVRAAVLTAPSRIGGRDIASGAGIVRVGQNDDRVHGAVREIVEALDIETLALSSGLADPGFPSLGSGDETFNLEAPAIAVLAEDGIQGYSFGWAWFTLDRQYEMPVTVLKTRSLAGRSLDRYDVIVVPSASSAGLRTAVGEAGMNRLKQWVRDGGSLVAIGAATDFARAEFDLALRSWYDLEEHDDTTHFSVPGAIFGVALDSLHWAASGSPAIVPTLVTSDRIYLPPEGPVQARRRVIGTYTAKMSGHAWPESLERIPGSVFAYEERVGQGRVIVFVEDVNFRAFHRGTNRLFLNAVVLGPSAP